MNRAKQYKKLCKVISKADECTTRDEAQKLLKKALKIDKKLNSHDDN
jgi:hypothetical protein